MSSVVSRMFRLSALETCSTIVLRCAVSGRTAEQDLSFGCAADSLWMRFALADTHVLARWATG